MTTRTLVRSTGALALTALVTCGGLDTFSITESSSATVPGSLVPDPLGIFSFTGFDSIDITKDEELQNQGVEKHQIDSVRLSRLSLRIVEPPGQDFRFIDSLAFYVSSAGLERQRIASGGPFAADATSVELSVDAVELAPYAAAESMSITTEASGSAPPADVSIEATIVLDVDVNVDGAVCGG